MNYANQLFGMSAIKQYHIEGCMRVLSNVYKRSRRQNNLITPQALKLYLQKLVTLKYSKNSITQYRKRFKFTI